LRAAAEQCAQDRVLIEQAALNDPRPIAPAQLEQEIARQRAQWGCRGAFDYKQLSELCERNLRIQRTRQEMVSNAEHPRDEEVEDFFNANRDKFPRPELFHASHIVKHVNHEHTEEEAEASIQDALAELERGEPFGEVADRHSDCKDKNGDLGQFPTGHMVQEFEDAIRALEPGQRSGIFTTPFGFHIALLHEKTTGRPASLDESRGAIERVMTFSRQHAAYLLAISEMRSRAEILWVPAAQGVPA
jgi:hypothetical protein